VVVSVEINEGTRRCIAAWWEASRQSGHLNQEFHDVQALGRGELLDLVKRYGGFDLIVGGSPCNNLSGNNMWTRVGLDGDKSGVFFEFSRIVSALREFAGFDMHR
jgi:site-specific DNA-cytosine methylase